MQAGSSAAAATARAAAGPVGEAAPSTRARARLERWLLAALFAAWAVALGLHVERVATDQLAQLPVFAAPGADGYPRVAGFRIETEAGDTPLRPGDRLVAVSGEDLRGVGHIGFDAIALEAAAQSGAALVTFERDGKQRTTWLRPAPHPVPWARAVAIASFLGVCVLLALRAPRSRSARLFVVAFATLGILHSQFYGGPREQTIVFGIVWNFLGPIGALLMLRWARLFPEEVPDALRASALWPYAGAAIYLAVRLNYVTGRPLPPEVLPATTSMLHAGLVVGVFALMLRNYRHADAVGRRRTRWILSGCALAVLPVVVVQALPLFAPSFPHFRELFAWSIAGTALVPVVVLIAVARFDLFDIDRLIGATASYTIAIVLAVGGLVAGVPALSRALAARSGMGEGTTRLVLGLALAAVVVPLARRLRPAVERYFFPERDRLARGVAALIEEMPRCASPTDVIERMSEGVDALLSPTGSAAYLHDTAEFRLRRALGAAAAAPERMASSAVDALLTSAPRAPGGVARIAEPTSGAIGRALPELLPALAVPVRSGRERRALLLLGPKRSGDIYTETDLSLLGALAERAGAEMFRMEAAALLRSERERTRELSARTDAAEHAHAARSRFLAAVSHDLRQPLHALQLFADALGRQGLGADERAELVQRIQQSTGALSELLSQLLDVSRLDVGAVEPRPASFAIDPVLERLVAELEPDARGRGLALRRVATRLHVRSDALLLTRILQNLLGNAVRHTRAGRVLVGCRRAGSAVRIEIHDSGPGIPPERQREIFEEFTQLPGASRSHGMGLGLSIVDRFARLLGHEVGVRSRPGVGSVFHVTVPGAPRPPAGSGRSTGERPLEPLAGRLVVVVDDDEGVREATAALLRSFGCDVATTDGEPAAEGFPADGGRPPDALIVDLRLAHGRSGLDVVAELRARHGAAIPALIVTGDTAPALLDAVRAQALPVLTKPVAPARLRAWLQAAIPAP